MRAFIQKPQGSPWLCGSGEWRQPITRIRYGPCDQFALSSCSSLVAVEVGGESFFKRLSCDEEFELARTGGLALSGPPAGRATIRAASGRRRRACQSIAVFVYKEERRQ